ncbi:MAG: response regulator [Rickettsiaceae bacterium]|nr:response regulator [Rickettsiaceae bacterium]
MTQDIILFVDDEVICHTLANLAIPAYTKYKLVSAYDGQQAIDLAREHVDNLALILSDVMLPDVNGYEIYNILRAEDKFKQIPFIFQSGIASQGIDLSQYIKEKVTIIYKPYKQEKLLELVKNVLDTV